MAQVRPPDEVILIDNGSTDGSRWFVRTAFPWVDLIESDENLGFAAGNNHGLIQATGDIIVFLNNDTIPGPMFLESIAAPIEAGRSDAVAGVLLFARNRSIVASAGIDVFENGLALDHGVQTRWDELKSEFPVFGPSAGAAAISKRALENVGEFPDSFFLYLEDVDLAWRLRLAQYQTVTSRDAWVLHYYSASSTEGSPLKDFYLGRNRAWVLIRCWPRKIWKKHWWSVLKYELLAVGYALLHRRWRSLSGRLQGWVGIWTLRRQRSDVQDMAEGEADDLLYWIKPAPAIREMLSNREYTKQQATE
jgi:GT2 family glycosyltransferase